jgi:endogenous inhibitor of DNA gyrase (YacG/DUF329 family)
MNKECKQCGKQFEPKNPKGAFCSTSCRQKDFRRRTAENIKLMKKEIEGAKTTRLLDMAEDVKAIGFTDAEIKAIAARATKKSPKPSPFKPKKEMPSGLSRTEQMRWMRENP